MDFETRVEKTLDSALKDFEDARNTSSKADALLLIKEIISAATMYVEYSRRKVALEQESAEEKHKSD